MGEKMKTLEKVVRYIFLFFFVFNYIALLTSSVEKDTLSFNEGRYLFIVIMTILIIAGILYAFLLFKRHKEGEKTKKIYQQIGIDILIVLFWAIFLGGIIGRSDILSAISSITILLLFISASGLLIAYFTIRRKSKNKGEIIRNVIQKTARHIITVLLVIFASYAIFITIINPESYFFGNKLSGIAAVKLLLTEGILAIVILFLLYKKKAVGEILSIMFFEYRFLEAYFSDLRIFQHSYEIPLSNIGLIGLALSVALLLLRVIE